MSAASADEAPRIGFKRHLRAEVAAGEGAYLFSEEGMTLLKGSHVESVVSLLDGTRDVATVLGSVPVGVTREQAAGVLATLSSAGLITLRSGEPQPNDSASAYWEAAGLDSGSAAVQTARSAVRLIVLGEVPGADAEAALRAAGLIVHTDGGVADVDLTVVLCSDYLDPRLAAIDAEQRAAGRPWLPAKPVGTKIWIGPIFDTTQPGCWHCLAARIWGNRNAERCAQTALGRSGPAPAPAVSIPPTSAAAGSLVAAEATKWLAGHRHANQRAVWTLDTLAMTGRHHAVPVRPQCPTCGDPDLVRARAYQPVVLGSRPKVADGGGGYRAVTPERTMAAYRHLISPVTGVVKEITRDERGPELFNVFRSGPNLAACDDLGVLRASLRMSNGGKGITPAHAEVSALCESVERYSASCHGDEAKVRGSLRGLGEVAIHPNDVMLYDERQYRDRAEWNRRHSSFQWVCEPFDDDAELDWTPVWSVTHRRHRLLPTALLYFGADGRAPNGRPMVRADSNGNAAGASLEDAVLQGTLELIERDAVAIWWYNRYRAAAVDLDAFADPWLDRVREAHAELGRQIWVLDLTSDLGIPVMVALSRRTDRETEDIIMGFGAHLDAAIALRRSLSELNQMMPVVVNATPDGRYDIDDPDAVAWWRHATIANQPYLRPDLAADPRTPRDYPRLCSSDLADDIELVRRRLAGQGLDLLVLDQTRPDIGLPVVKVVVPGLRHFWSRFAPGRLYDVPVRLGRRATPADYSELNPMPMFL
ncbi:TOMM precursor leader peptide-binding protein [Actinokineospora sp. UTMC 2448]|uniref:TOMM precursor leader peptide-binding protein n=1 Tax=Actinokineospora sp. UTMC 2448 TaxID=2268449 RepID=UPI0021646273|nr:TOMM precursor leader peptide-binding protein [Actinokineospora sp. UTMC 2448]UVS79992.1 bacteriocin biosynthesis docking scaffold, SagD family [Actinokineospora sp. UTMC 2448]